MRNLIDSYFRVVDPEKALRRAQDRLALKVLDGYNEGNSKRGYDAALDTRKTAGFFSRFRTSAEQETSKAADRLAYVGQELTRNNPLANRVKKVWANNTVGQGIKLEVSGPSKSKSIKFNQSFEDWAESTDCDFEGQSTLYGLQWLWMATIVESGGVLIRRHINPAKSMPLQLQTFEQTMLDRSKNGSQVTDGIARDDNGQITGYWILSGKNGKSKFHKADTIIHIFRKERCGQHLGISWFASSAITFNDFATLTDAKLMQQQIAACFAVIMEQPNTAVGVNNGKGTSELPDEVTPGLVYHAKAGTTPHVITPPKADNAAKFDVALKQEMAAGTGLTYEQLTGDYSLVTFASGRMGKSESNAELDYVQKVMFKPALNRIFTWFRVVRSLKTGDTGVFIPDWTFPPRAAVNPQEEFDVLMSKVRHCMMSPQKAAKILGEKFPEIVERWKEAKEVFGDLPFDIDPSVFASTGNQLMTAKDSMPKEELKQK